MLRYFRINDPYRLIGLLVLLIILYAPLFVDSPDYTFLELKSFIVGEKLNEDQKMYTGVVDNTAPLAAWVNEITESAFGRSVIPRHIIALLLIFLQGSLLAIIFISRKAFNENTYIPAFMFCMLTFMSYDMIALSGELIGLTFLLFALHNLFTEIEFRIQRDEIIFNLGLFVSVASLFSFGYFIYLFCVIAILFFFTRTTLRKFLLLVFGFLLPHLLVVSIAYLNGSFEKLWDYYYLANLGFTRQTFISTSSLLTLLSIPILYFVLSLFMLQREARFSKYQSQLLQIMFLWVGFSIIYLLYCKNLRPQHLIVFVPGLAFIFSHFFLLIRRKRYAEINLWILVIGLLIMGYMARYNKLDSVDYSKLTVPAIQRDHFPSNKKILVLENDLSLLRDNKLATPYLNWRLSETIFKNPQYFENITEVYHSLKVDPPDVIIDRENLMLPFFDRMPELKRTYIRSGILYHRTVNN